MYKLVQHVISIWFSRRHIHIDTFDCWAMTERQKVMQVVISICKALRIEAPFSGGSAIPSFHAVLVIYKMLNIRKRLSSQTFPMSSPQSVAKSVPQKWQVPSSCKSSGTFQWIFICSASCPVCQTWSEEPCRHQSQGENSPSCGSWAPTPQPWFFLDLEIFVCLFVCLFFCFFCFFC